MLLLGYRFYMDETGEFRQKTTGVWLIKKQFHYHNKLNASQGSRLAALATMNDEAKPSMA